MISFKNATTDQEAELIAQWYHEQWAIPVHETISSLENQPNPHVYVQRLLLEDGAPIGTGGLYGQVGIQNKVEKYRSVGPWIGLMYTRPEQRGQGLGQLLLGDIENQAKEQGFSRIFLFTHTAERLYLRHSWKPIEHIANGEKRIVVMEKEL